MDADIKAIAFDVDGTLITSSIWDDLFRLFGVPEGENERNHMSYVRGEISFREQMDGINDFFIKTSPRPTEAAIREVFATFRFISGAEEAVRELRERGYPLALISSGFSDYVNPVAEFLSIAHPYAYVSLSYESGLYGGMQYESESDELSAKVSALNDFAARIGVSPQEIVFVGDSKNDVEAFTHTGRGILVGDGRGNEELKRAAWKQVASISEILPIL